MMRRQRSVVESPPSPWAIPAGMGKSVAIGCVVGMVVFFVVACGGMLLLDVGWGAAVGLGLFVSIWGGIGFGSMVGGVMYLTRADAAAAAAVAARTTPTTPADPIAAPPPVDAPRAPIPLPAVLVPDVAGRLDVPGRQDVPAGREVG